MPVDWSQFSDTKPTSHLDDALNGIDIASKVNTVQNIPSSKEVDWSQFSTTPPKTKGNVDWSQFSDTKPTSHLDDVLSNIDNVTKVVPKTKAPIQQLDTSSSKVNSYKDINLHGMQYPERTLTDVLTGRLGTPQEVQDRINQQLSDSQHQDAPLEDVSDELIPGIGFIPKGSKELEYLGDAVKSGAISKQAIKQHEPLLKAVQSGDVSPKVANNIIQSDPKIQQALKQKSFTDIIAENVAKEPEPITNLIDKHLVDMGEEPHFKTSEELSPTQEEVNPLDNHPDYMKEEPIGLDGSPLFSKGEENLDKVTPSLVKVLDENHNAVSHDILQDGAKIGRVKTSKDGNILNIDDIELDKSGTGLGSQTIKNIMQEADKKGLTITLTSDAMRGKIGQQKNRELYQRLGFTKNSGINKDKSISEEFYYKPQQLLMSKGAQGTTTAESIHQSAKKLLGKNYDNLKGDINIVQSYKDLPKELVDNGVDFSSGGKVRGIFNPKDGKVHLVADTMNPKEVNGVLVHELLHKADFAGEKILGESHDTLLLRLKQLKEEPLVKQAFKSAKDAGTDTKNINREMMSYLVEKYQTGVDMSPKLKQFTRNIIDAVKVFASRTAVKLGVDAKWLISKMNEKDIAALLKSSAIKQEVKTVSKDSEALFSKTPIKEQLTNTVDKATEMLQDYWKPAEKILLKTDKNMSFKLGEKVNDARKAIFGRTGERIAQVRDSQQLIVNNITKYSKLIGEDTEAIRKDLNSFMIAQHAPERNRALQDGAAGINTRTALKSLIDLRKNNPEKYNFLSNMANGVRKLNEKTLDILKDGQVITPELHAELRNKYKMHVPLQRIMPEEKETAGIITGGKGFSVKSTGIKVAKGSDLEVSDIIGNVSANIQEAIIRVEKNRVGLAMYDLFKADKSLGEARGLRMIGKDLKNNPIMEIPNEDSIVLFKDGKKKIIIPNDPIIAKVYNQLNVEDKGIIASTIAPITRTMAGLYTRYNLEFALSNIIRDIQEAFVYNSAEMSGKDAIRALGNQPWSVKAVTESLLGKDTEGTRLYHQMKMDGGTTGGINISTRGKVHQDVDDMFKLAKSNPRKALKGVLDSIEHYNTIFEDSTRLAAYKQALEKGLSRDRASTIAKETSIDFDRKGTATPWVNSIYMFSNASIQGSYKMIKAFKNPKVLGSTVGIISGISVAVDSHNDTVDPDWRNKVNDFERTSNYVILLDNKDGNLRRMNIPIGWGFKPIKTMVESLRDISVGKSQGNPVTRVLSSIGQSYMPVNGRDIWSDITPSVLSALKDVHDNINWKGQMISPKGMDLAQPSDKYFPNTPETLGGRLAIKLVEGTEKIGIDLTPEDIKYLASTYGGGPLNFSTGVVNMLTSATKGDSIKPEDMVMARRFYKETNPDRLDKYEGSQDIKKMVQKVQQGDTVQDRIKIIQEELPKINEKDRAKAVYALKYGGLLPNKQSVIRDAGKAQWSEDILNPFTSSTDTKK